MGFLLVLKAELVRSLIIMRRYWFATLMGLLLSYVMLMGLIFAITSGAIDLKQYLGAVTGKMFGLAVGMFAFSIVGMFSQGLAGMARSGELEQVYMSPHGLITNFMARSFVSSILMIVLWTIMLVLVTRTLKSNIHGDPLPVLTLLALTYFNLIGFGFMVGGLVLVFKQTGQLTALIRLAMVAVAFQANENLYTLPKAVQIAAHVVPITDAAICLKLVVIGGIGMGIFTHPSFFFLIANCTLWTVVGLLCFKYMENWARDKGTLGAF